MTRVFSFCIYGPPDPKYYTGLLENIEIVDHHFPGWSVIVYVGADVPSEYVQALGKRRNVILRTTGITGHKNSVYRFFAIDEPWIDVMLVRDADSRIHWKDRWAIRVFMSSGYSAHIIRDHHYHAEVILAGLWGLRKGVLTTSIRSLYAAWTPVSAGSGADGDPHGFGIDQNFLKMEIYPKIKTTSYVTFSNNRILGGETGVEFPFDWNPNIYCGRVEEVNYSDSTVTDPTSGVIRLPKTVLRFDTAHASPMVDTGGSFREIPAISQSSGSVLNFLNKK